MYKMVLRLVVPDWVLTQYKIWFKSKVTKNIRSLSFKCDMEKIETFGFPLLSYNIFCISKSTPSIHDEKLGDATRLFSDMTRLNLSLDGKKDSISKTPTLFIGGF